MIIEVDDYLYDSGGAYRWTNKRFREAWKKAMSALSEAASEDKLLVLPLGLPGSGKSTWAKEYDEDDLVIFGESMCLEPKWRAKALGAWRDSGGGPCAAVVLMTPWSEAWDRNAARAQDRMTPRGAFDSLRHKAVYPRASEGFVDVADVY